MAYWKRRAASRERAFARRKARRAHRYWWKSQHMIHFTPIDPYVFPPLGTLVYVCGGCGGYFDFSTPCPCTTTGVQCTMDFTPGLERTCHGSWASPSVEWSQ